MDSERHIPSDILKPYIKAFIIMKSGEGMVNRILPDTSMVMVFRYKGNVSLKDDADINNVPASALTGLRETFRLVGYDKDTETLLVLFHEGGAAAFFNEPLHEIFGASLSLDHFAPAHRVQEIEERLCEANNSLQRITIVEQFLISLLKKYQGDLLIMHSVQKIREANGNLRIKDLVKELHISQDNFEKRFRKIIGATPKKYSAIVRFRNLIEHYSTADSLTQVAYDAGYFDQAHFIKDFKAFTGQTPLDFFKTSAYW